MPALDPVEHEAALLLSAGVATENVSTLRLLADRLGIGLIEAARAENVIDDVSLYRAIAEMMEVPFARTGFTIAASDQWRQAFHAGIAALSASHGRAELVAAPQGVALMQLFQRRREFSRSQLVITTPQAFHDALIASNAANIAGHANGELANAFPDDSAGTSVMRRHVMIGSIGLLAIVLMAIIADGILLSWFSFAVGWLFLLNVSLRLSALFETVGHRDIQPPPLPDSELPAYSIFVPLYRETRVLPALIASLAALDYPVAKRDVHLLIEEHDAGMRAALALLELPPGFLVTTVPAGMPQTKPRALNVGLALARGTLCTVYDAEDRPEPDQLRKAAALFATSSSQVACLQARLAIDHAEESWISKLFALEYAMLFDVIIPGLAAQGLPLALGGTSNHFRIAHLRAVKGWDAWNVTEDADLGLRLFRQGYRIRALASTTYEEAPLTLKSWMNQRTRWMKGWLQTTIVHFRAARRVAVADRPFEWSSTIAMTLGTLLTALFGPLLAIIHTVDLVEMISDTATVSLSVLHFAVWVFAFTLAFIGLLAMLLLAIAGARRRHLTALMPWIAVLPIYYVLMSAAAWLAIKDYLLRPFHWRKTEHGLARQRRPLANVRSTSPRLLQHTPEK
ncbi:MAG: glycosyltransferase family 2 protein [Beijerinckiaceae bacterium]